MKWIIMALLFAIVLAGTSSAHNRKPASSLSNEQLKALALAVEDEVYDRSYQKRWWSQWVDATLRSNPTSIESKG
jgi:hypothetical protein